MKRDCSRGHEYDLGVKRIWNTYGGRPSNAELCRSTKSNIVVGIETFPERLLKLFNGENFGKLVLQVAIEYWVAFESASSNSLLTRSANLEGTDYRPALSKVRLPMLADAEIGLRIKSAFLPLRCEIELGGD